MKNLSRFPQAFARLAGAFTFAILLNHQPAQAQTDSVDVFLQEIMQQRAIPGMQVAVVQKGRIIKLGAYGVANLEYKVPVTNQTTFSLNSITKSFTGVALMQLVEEGKLALDAPAAQYLDNLPLAWQKVTVKQLASHTAGLPNVIDPATGEWTFQTLGDAGWAQALTQPNEFAAGQKFSYNQTGYVLLGQIIEKLTGKPFAEIVTERQLKTAGLQKTGFGDFSDVVPGLAKPYVVRNRKHMNVAEHFPTVTRTAAGMYSTAQEVAQWTIALQQGKLLENTNSLKALWAPTPLTDGQLGGFSRLLNGYGIGWPTMTRAEHPAVGGIGGGRSAFFIYPQDDVTIVVLTNRMGCAPESFIDELASFYVPSMKPSTGFGLPAEVLVLHKAFTKKGFQNAEKIVQDLKRRDKNYQVAENDLNDWGYLLWKQGKLPQALAVFKLNVALYPNSGNAYDSYAEALLENGQKDLAIQNYKRAVALNPKNNGAIKQLQALEGK
ncbi:serine hydrolase domain-containing protein [Rufibacter sp. DG15C]|uniref:serine hydrolase domain-containing protein n=1 Tax=Rufibacter sp. DG15C TaxID=1379909 RepID=UPI000837980B|nr:serine hydrolase domain-containing protein [Rufibacter sp. DG15C]